jgi:hypothetical protein
LSNAVEVDCIAMESVNIREGGVKTWKPDDQ